MHSDCFQMAGEGWKIISSHPVPRDGARRLLIRLAEFLEAQVAGIRYVDAGGGYSWEERVDRCAAPQEPSAATRFDSRDDLLNFRIHRFPEGESCWFFNPGVSTDPPISELLDLLAGQWLHLRRTGRSSRTDGRPAARSVTGRCAGDTVFQAWTAVSRAARDVLEQLVPLIHDPSPLLLLGECGTGRSHMARLIQRLGPEPSEPPLLMRFPSNFRFRNDTREIMEHSTDHRRMFAVAESADDPSDFWRSVTAGRGRVLRLPPLRYRREDIPLLAGVFLEECYGAAGLAAPGISSSAIAAFSRYEWPGNARELREVMASLHPDTPRGIIAEDDLPPAIRGAASQKPGPPMPQRLSALELDTLLKELRRQNGNMSRAARALGMTPRQVSWRVRKYGIDPADYKSRRSTGPHPL